MKLLHFYQNTIKKLPIFDGVPSLLIRLYLAPIFIIAGLNKIQLLNPDVTGIASLMADPNIIAWFGGLGIPFPTLLANLAAWTEILGGWMLLFGVLVRLISIPLMFTMIIAATTVHAEHGWFAITPTNQDTSPAKVLTWFGSEQAEQSLENSTQTAERLDYMREILEENGNTEWLFEKGNIVVLNNGIEFSATYFLMLFALFFIGAGRYTSIDYYASRIICRKLNA